jgi:hypothetical protein
VAQAGAPHLLNPSGKVGLGENSASLSHHVNLQVRFKFARESGQFVGSMRSSVIHARQVVVQSIRELAGSTRPSSQASRRNGGGGGGAVAPERGLSGFAVPAAQALAAM